METAETVLALEALVPCKVPHARWGHTWITALKLIAKALNLAEIAIQDLRFGNVGV